MSAGLSIRVATYNVHGCVGFDRRYNPSRVARVICDVDADVVALQEVDWRHPAWEGSPALDYIAGACEMTPIAGPSMRDDAGEYGNAVLTRLPIDAVRRIDLSQPGREPRGAIELDLRADGRDVRVIATHLGLSRPERRRQRRWLGREIDAAERRGEPVVLLADMNEWLPYPLAVHRRPHLPFDVALGACTFPSPLPFLRLDRILADPEPTEAAVWSHREAPAKLASDHLPLVADLRWSEAALAALGSGAVGDRAPVKG